MTKTILICISALLVIVAVFYGPKVTRLYKPANLYNEDKIASNFINIDKILKFQSLYRLLITLILFQEGILIFQILTILKDKKEILRKVYHILRLMDLWFCTTVIYFMKIIGMAIQQPVNI